MSQTHLFASILDLAELSVPPFCAPSMADWLLGNESADPNQTLFFEVDFMPIKPDPDRRIQKRGLLKSGRYKFILDRKTGTEFLFDLQVDPGERNNRAADPSLAPLLLDLRAELNGNIWY